MLSSYSSGREPCTDKVFSPGLGVLSWFVFQHSSPGDTTLSEPRDSSVVSLRLALYHYKLVYKLVCLAGLYADVCGGLDVLEVRVSLIDPATLKASISFI